MIRSWLCYHQIYILKPTIWWNFHLKWCHLLSYSVSVRAANYTLKVLNVFNSCLRDFEMLDFSKIAFRYFVRLKSGKQHLSVFVSLSMSVSVSVFVSVSAFLSDINYISRSQWWAAWSRWRAAIRRGTPSCSAPSAASWARWSSLQKNVADITSSSPSSLSLSSLHHIIIRAWHGTQERWASWPFFLAGDLVSTRTRIGTSFIPQGWWWGWQLTWGWQWRWPWHACIM